MEARTICSICGEVQSKCKGLCVRCYSKERRKTDAGKVAMKRYNDSEKAKECRKRYKAKQPPKQPKQIKYCECGKKALAKGLCTKHYHEQYFKSNKLRLTEYSKQYYKSVERKKKRGPKPGPKIDMANVYNNVIELVSNGETISNALMQLNVERSTFYRRIDDKQKIYLRRIKALNGCSHDGIITPQINFFDNFL